MSKPYVLTLTIALHQVYTLEKALAEATNITRSVNGWEKATVKSVAVKSPR